MRRNDDPAQLAFKQALQRAGLPLKGGPHSLRHSFATHMIDANAPLHLLKRLLGHNSVTNGRSSTCCAANRTPALPRRCREHTRSPNARERFGLRRFCAALKSGTELPHRAALPNIERRGCFLGIIFPRDPAKSSVAWVVEASSGLNNWDQVLYDSRLDLRENNYGSRMRIEDWLPLEFSPDQGRFFRVRLLPPAP